MATMADIEELKDSLFRYKKRQIAEILYRRSDGLSDTEWERDIRSICRMSLKELRDKLAGYIEDLEWEVDMRLNGHTKAYQERARKRLGGKLSPYWESVHQKIRKG